jgi:hypothetical protein
MASPTIRKIFSREDVSSSIIAMTGSAVAATDPRTASLWYDMTDFVGFGLSVMVDAAIAVSAIEFRASKSSDGSSPISVKSVDLTGITTTAAGDYINTELHEDEVAQAVANLDLGGVSNLQEYRYITAAITAPSDKVIATFIGMPAHVKDANLSPNHLT